MLVRYLLPTPRSATEKYLLTVAKKNAHNITVTPTRITLIPNGQVLELSEFATKADRYVLA